MSELIFDCEYDPKYQKILDENLKPVEEKYSFWNTLVERWRWKRYSSFDTSWSWLKVGVVNLLSLVVIYLLIKEAKDA